MSAITHILVIEDNPADVATIRVLLDDVGYKYALYQSNTLSEGLLLLEETPIDVVLLDLSLQDSLGFTTLKNFLKEQPRVPVIVLTGNNNVVLGDQSVRAGAQDYLVKGEFTGKRLVDTIRYSQQRYKSQAALQRRVNQMEINEKRFQEVQQLAQLGNWQIDIVTNAMYWSEEMYRILDLPPSRQQHRWSDYLDRVHSEDKPKLEAFLDEALKSGEMHRLDHRVLIGGRTIKYVAVQAKLNFDEATNKIMLFGSLQDITQLKNTTPSQEAEAAVVEVKTPLPIKAGLAELGFNIRTPLNAIVSLLYLLDKDKPHSQQKEIIATLKTVVDELSIGVDALLGYAVDQDETLSPTESTFLLGDLIKNTVQLFRLKCKHAGINLEIKPGQDVSDEAGGDYQLITQLFYYVFTLLIPYCDKKNRVEVTFQRKELTNNKLSLHLLITYYGKPIPVLDITDTAKSPGGVSASIVEKLLITLGGQWKLEKKGFHWYGLDVQLPLSMPGKEKKSDRPVLPLHILLVEDHLLNQVVTKKVLKSWSDLVSVDIAGNGAEALAKFAEYPYDLIIMDLYMPVMDGIQATTEIRKTSKVPIIAMTAGATKQEEEGCRIAGMDAYLPKPLKPEELSAKIMELLG